MPRSVDLLPHILVNLEVKKRPQLLDLVPHILDHVGSLCKQVNDALVGRPSASHTVLCHVENLYT